jgi:hypothetical protein
MICDGPWVVAVHLSHNEISATCPQTISRCTNKRQIKVATVAPDVPPSWYAYSVSGGQVIGLGPNVIWDLSDAKPGSYTITTGLKIPFADAFKVLGRTITESIVVR